MDTKPKIVELLRKPLWQMTGEEYVALHAYACTINTGEMAKSAPITRITGVRALAGYCACCESTIYALMRVGALDAAIISRIGKKIVFDGEMALKCASEYQNQKRGNKGCEIDD